MLEELDELNVEVTYRRALQSSVAYMLMTRLSLPAPAYILPEDFADIYSFDTPSTINALGIATSDIAEMGLREDQPHGDAGSAGGIFCKGYANRL